MSKLDQIKRDLSLDDISPDWSRDGVPRCSERCHSHDGKRCEKLGFRPSDICEPAVMRLLATEPKKGEQS